MPDAVWRPTAARVMFRAAPRGAPAGAWA